MDNDKWADMVVNEIQQLREDMREDVNMLHEKIDRKFEKLDEKLDADSDEISKEIGTKVPMAWYRYTLYVAIILSLAMGGSTVANQVSNARTSTQVEEHIKYANESMTKLEKKIDEHFKKTTNLINGRKKIGEPIGEFHK